MLVFT